MRSLYHWWGQTLSPEKCEELIQECKVVPEEAGSVFSGVDGLRNSTIRWVQDLPGITNIIWPYVFWANRESFNIDANFIFDVQFTEYSATKEQHYSWHHDVDFTRDSGYDRKLSVSIQLSDPNEYDGGDLEFQLFKTPEDCRKRGSVIIFPSYLDHQVTPVTRGTRYSLVTWVEGPRWR